MGSRILHASFSLSVLRVIRPSVHTAHLSNWVPVVCSGSSHGLEAFRILKGFPMCDLCAISPRFLRLLRHTDPRTCFQQVWSNNKRISSANHCSGISIPVRFYLSKRHRASSKCNLLSPGSRLRNSFSKPRAIFHVKRRLRV